MTNENNNNDDVISVEPDKKDEVVNTVDVNIPNMEAPVQRAEISEPYFPVKENYKHLDRTINITGTDLTDKEIYDIMDEKEKEIIKSQPGDKFIESFIAVISAYQEILSTNFSESDFRKVFSRLNSEFVQKITGDKGKNIMINSPIFEPSRNSNILEGANAIRFLSASTGVGNVMRIPLWHSGIVITVDSFKERRLLDLHQSLVRQKMDIGTNTKGASFTGDDVIVTSTIVEFILEHIIESSLTNWDIDKLRVLILANDIPAILAGALACIYPKGYPIFHQCINVGKGTCNYAIEAKRSNDIKDFLPDHLLDFRKVLWVDNKRLTINDRNFMSVFTPSHTVEEIKEYQKRVNHLDEFVKGKELFKNDIITVFANFKISNLKDYFDICNEWCTRIVEMVDKTMTLDKNLDAEERMKSRNTVMNQYASTVNLIKQSNWVDYLTIVDKEGTERKIEDNRTINNALEVFGQSDGFEAVFEKYIQQFKQDSLFAFTGFPNFECPSCGCGQTEPESKYPSLIPMNMVSYFFILTVWRNRTT